MLNNKGRLLLVLSTCLAGSGALAAELEPINVVAKRLEPNRETSLLGLPAQEDHLPASIAVITERDIQERQPDRLEEVIQQTGLLPGSSNAGLSTALNARGFDLADRLTYNGHPDILRLFVRDLATVERVEVWKGQLSLLYGQGSPGATIGYVGKQPQGTGQGKVSASIGSFGQKRIVADFDSPANDAGVLNYRLVYAGQEGGTFIDHVSNDRQTLYSAISLNYSKQSALRLELEGQRNDRPISFGTVYIGGQFQYDRSYVGPQAHSDRRYGRVGLYWDQSLGESWKLHGALSNAEVNRDERLVGFWTITTPTQLSGYYRAVSDHVEQQNARLELRGDLTTGSVRHQASFGLTQDKQHINFLGLQNIGGFNLSVADPRFEVDLNALPLQTKISRDRYVESGAFVVDRISLGDQWHLLAGLRRSGVRVNTDNGKTTGVATDVGNTAATWGVVHTPETGRSYYLSRSESFDPNRGTDRFGGFIPPKQARQYEIGAHAQDDEGASRLHAALFNIEQSNLTTTDPLDRNSLIAVGTIRSTGLEIEGRRALGAGFALAGQAATQRVRNVRKIVQGLGDELPGVPSHFGSVTLEKRFSGASASKLWATITAIGKRWGDTGNTFTAPGYSRVDMGATFFAAKDTEFLLMIANALDKRYVAAISAADDVYQGERRRLSATVRHSF